MFLSIDRFSSRERLRLACAFGFWAATYLLFVAWNQLQDDFPSAIWQTRRLLATGFGAGLFYLMTWAADRVSGWPQRQRLALIAGVGGASLVAMVAAREFIDHFILPIVGDPLATVERHVRFTLIWAGWFLGGSLAFGLLAPAEHAVEPIAPQLPAPEPTPALPEALWVSRGRETARVPISEIEWIEAEGDYVRLHAGSRGGLLRNTLSGLDAKLDPAVFVRVHRSAICRKSLIAALLRRPSGALALRLEGGTEVPVGRRYRDAVAALVERERLSA